MHIHICYVYLTICAGGPPLGTYPGGLPPPVGSSYPSQPPASSYPSQPPASSYPSQPPASSYPPPAGPPAGNPAYVGGFMPQGGPPPGGFPSQQYHQSQPPPGHGLSFGVS